jgi:hypothetical protein
MVVVLGHLAVVLGHLDNLHDLTSLHLMAPFGIDTLLGLPPAPWS